MPYHAKLHLIYIPGLGDDNVALQRAAVTTWRLWGVSEELFQMKWSDDTEWEVKFKRLLKRIDTLTSEGHTVALVGASAGASAVINAFAARRDNILGCVLLAGKVNHPEAIGNHYRTHYPSFVSSAYQCPASLEQLDAPYRQRILSRYASRDATVARRDSVITGAHNQQLISRGHVLTIGTQIVFGAPGFIRFLSALPRQ